jgi:hypothetical protein
MTAPTHDVRGASPEGLRVRTIDLLPFPYPVAFAFWQAAPTRAKYLLMRNRCQLIEFEDFSGATRTLLVNPSEADLSARAGFFEQARRELLPFVPVSLLTRAPGAGGAAGQAGGRPGAHRLRDLRSLARAGPAARAGR